MLTVAGVNVEKEAGEGIDSPASDAFSVLYPFPLDKLEITSICSIEICSAIEPNTSALCDEYARAYQGEYAL